MPHSENLYFIALILRRELRERITLIKQDFANRFNSKTALKVYPHIIVAYRNLSSEMFSKVWSEYQHKTFDASFEVDAVYLLQHDSKNGTLLQRIIYLQE